jgi:hypothetical protein
LIQTKGSINSLTINLSGEAEKYLLISLFLNIYLELVFFSPVLKFAYPAVRIGIMETWRSTADRPFLNLKLIGFPWPRSAFAQLLKKR